jgi:hypothetical protein
MVKIIVKKEKKKRTTQKQKQKQKQTQKVIVNIGKDVIKRKRSSTKSTIQKKQATTTPTINVPQGLPTITQQSDPFDRFINYMKEREKEKEKPSTKNNELETDKKEEVKQPAINDNDEQSFHTVQSRTPSIDTQSYFSNITPSMSTISPLTSVTTSGITTPFSFSSPVSHITLTERLVQIADREGEENPNTGNVIIDGLFNSSSSSSVSFPPRSSSSSNSTLSHSSVKQQLNDYLDDKQTEPPRFEPPVFDPDEDELINAIPQADMEQYKTYTTQVNQAEQTFGTQTNEQPLTEYLSNMQQGPALETIDPNAEIEEEVVQVENRGAAAAADNPSNKAPPEEDKYKGWSKRRLIEFLQSNGLNTYKIYKDGTTYPKITLAELKAYVKDHDHS